MLEMLISWAVDITTVAATKPADITIKDAPTTTDITTAVITTTADAMSIMEEVITIGMIGMFDITVIESSPQSPTHCRRAYCPVALRRRG